MKIADIISCLEDLAHPSLQEGYDNTGLLTGDPGWDCTGIVVALDATEAVIREAIEKKCNCVITHHPVIFRGLKKIDAHHYVGKAVIAAIKNDIAIYAIHTNLDNIITGVNGRIAALLGMKNISVLAPKEHFLKKLFTFVPIDKAEDVRAAIFATGAGNIGNYSECSFNTEGTGTFRAGDKTDPYVGKKGEQHRENEIKMEMIFPAYLEKQIIKALKAAHPYEEVAYDIVNVSNSWDQTGSGIIGDLPETLTETALLARLKDLFVTPVIRHTAFTGKMIQRIALCGGAGSFLITKALAAGAQAYVTSDIKYHEFLS